MACKNRCLDAVYLTRLSLGKRLLREFQLQAGRRVPERRDILLTERSAGAGRTLANLLQHRKATLFAGLQTTSTGSKADRSFPGAWKSGKQATLPTFPRPRLRQRAKYPSR
jgi:hypothetical protein